MRKLSIVCGLAFLPTAAHAATAQEMGGQVLFAIIIVFCLVVFGGIALVVINPTHMGTTGTNPACPKCGNSYAWRPWKWLASLGGPEPHICSKDRGGCGYNEDYKMAAERMANAEK